MIHTAGRVLLLLIALIGALQAGPNFQVAAQTEASTSPVAPAASSPATAPATDPLRYFLPPAREGQHHYETVLNGLVEPAKLRVFHDMLASEPHMAGTPGDARVIAKMAEAFKSMGLQVQVHEFWPYLSTPIDAALEILAPDPVTLSLREESLSEDRISQRDDLPMGFNAYSGSGDVTGQIVYANYGTRADFDKLNELGIDCGGRIVIARYGGNFRGYKAKFAEQAGAIGLIIYTDPQDSGYQQGVPYPEGCWANGSAIQRGSLDTLGYPGDPLTPETFASENAERLDPNDLDLPHIPVQPIGYAAAGEIFARMRGRALPPELVKNWQGGLPCAYRLEGGAPLRVRLMVKQERAIKKTANLIATLTGSEFPDQRIIIGCHHDAWVCGAGDPTSGTILVFEAARCFAELARQGKRPRRTIQFCCWGAEEYGMMGSTEFCEQYADQLRRSAVAYVNLDAAGMGTSFAASAAPPLKTLIEEITREVSQPFSKQSVFEAWGKGGSSPPIGDLGGWSDHVGFYCHLGIPSCSMGAGGAAGTAYHSVYDNLYWYRKCVGDDYAGTAMLTRVVNLFAARMANAEILPVDISRLAPDVSRHLDELEAMANKRSLKLDCGALRLVLARFGDSSQLLNQRLAATLADSPAARVDWWFVNSQLREISRGPIEPDGLLDRPWFANLYAASDPDSGYAAWILPALRWSIENEMNEAVQAYADDLADRFAGFSGNVDAVLSHLEHTRPGAVEHR
jgi:N-acetylated-alpha-linked acidic dipeptidase